MVRFAEMEPEGESDMSDPKMMMEVPPPVRDFAVKSVDQAERAISSFMESASKSVAMSRVRRMTQHNRHLQSLRRT
jgi:hypothetical protein